MKLRTNIKRFTYVSAGILLLGISMASSFFAYKPPSAAAAGSPGAAIINGFPNALCAPTLGYISPGTQELMSVLSNSGINGPAGAENQMDQAFVKYQGDQVAQDTFGALYYNLGAGKTPGINVPQQNVEVITFSGAQGATNNDVLCKQTLVFFRAASDRSSNNFYGVWSCVDPKDPSNSPGCQYGHGPQFKFVTATVNLSAKTLSFSIPGGVSATGANALTLGDPNKLLSNCNYFSSSTACGGNGGGTGAGGNQQTLAACIIAVDTQKGYNTCLATAVANSGDASYTDIAHISFDGQTYIAGKWSGPNIHYSLDSSSSDKDLAGLSPYFDVNMGNSQTAYNVSSTTSVSALKQLGDVLTRNNKEGVVGVSFHAGNYSTSVPTDMTGLGNIATYYPASKSIQLDFTNGYGSNESHYYGVYTRQTATDYVLESGGYSGCGTNDKPMFTLSQDPSLPSVGSGGDGHNTGLTSTPTLEATWRLWANSTPCGYADITPVNVVVAPANTTPPSLNPGGTSGGGNSTPTCDSSGFSLSWIVCAIVNGLQEAVGNIYDKVLVPLLSTQPITNNSKTNQKVQAAWSTFRILANIILVIALLVIVFGESLGGGLIDAYTAKKALPKILAAAILINLSYYIAAVMIDVTNVLGNGLIDLIVKPFSLSGGFSVTLNGTSSAGLIAGLGAVIVWGAMSGALLGFLWSFILLPAFLISIAILLVVLLRNAFIVFLVIISPVAFALYALPNTEKYFKKWWDAFVETLMVFPIIAVMFAIGKVGAFLVSNAGETSQFAPGVVDTIAGIFSVVILFAPLALIPFAFRMAGGIIGRAHEAISGARERVHKMGEGNRERIRGIQRNNRTQSRQNMYAGLQSQASKGGALRRNTIGRGLKLAARGIGGYNIEAAASAARAQVGKEVNDQIATGQDQEVRGLSVNKKWALQQAEGTWWRNKDGKRQFKSLGGAWVDEADVDAGHRRWGNNTFAQQASLAYEMRKAQTEEQLHDLGTNYHNIATGSGGWGMSDQQAGGAWIGAAFEHQNQHLEYKSTEWQTGALKRDDSGALGGTMVDEMYEKRGSYNLAQMGSHTIEQLKAAHKDAVARGDTDTQQKIAAISETFMHQYGGLAGAAGAGPDEQALATSGTPPTAGGARQATTPGAAHVAERVRELAEMTGIYGAAPTGSYGPGHQPNTPTPNRREQS